ncbi:MAG: hypothetical protein JRH16_04685 [Deltaproteobacteria bacterium]|nr:hypothetical protein [Deltaproteobacteria bacterium]MBW2362546.1 hypothetical protein [Deltaproteobacteria bacterium]
MSSSGSSDGLTREELAWEFVELFDELSVDHVNEMLAKNVPLETLRFIGAYTEDFADVHELGERTRKSLPNLMVFGYLLKVLEERLLDDEPS